MTDLLKKRKKKILNTCKYEFDGAEEHGAKATEREHERTEVFLPMSPIPGEVFLQ